MSARVLLFADFGKGPRSFGTVKRVPGEWRTAQRFILTTRQRNAKSVGRWWLVECESAEAGRRIIAAGDRFAHESERLAAWGLDTRILDSGSNEVTT